MGIIISSKIDYSCEISPETETSTGIYRNPLCKFSTELTFSLNPYILTLQDAFLSTVKLHESKNFLGTRNPHGLYEYKSFKEVKFLVECLGSAILNINLAPEFSEYKDYKCRFIAIYSKNREEYLLCELVCMLYNLISIPIYETINQSNFEFILNQTNVNTIFCSADTFKFLSYSKSLANIKTIVCFDNINEICSEKIKEKNINILKFKDLLALGREEIQPFPKIVPENIYTISYTSGTTGTPKGVMLSHKNVISAVSGIKQIGNFKSEDSHLSYLPMAHIFEKIVISVCIYDGLSIGFYSGDTLKLKDDLQAFRPTIFASVPRLYNKFYESMQMNMDKMTGIKKVLLSKAISSKLTSLKSTSSYTNTIYDKLVFGKMRYAFGGRVRFMASGSAPILPEVLDFLKIAVGCPLVEGYGQTETSGVSFLTTTKDPESGTVGGPLINTEFKLIDVKEMNYTTKDINESGIKVPRGEILIRGPGVFEGYYKDEEKTKEIIDEEGWVHTGDIGILLLNGSLKIIDRKKNIFKLSQGEYIAPEKIENIYMKCKFIKEIFVYGDSYESFLVAIIVPNQEEVDLLAQDRKVNGSYQDICANKKVIDPLLKELDIHAKANGLQGVEIIKKIHLETQSFSKHDLWTTTFKLKRFKAKEIFEKEIKLMYEKKSEL